MENHEKNTQLRETISKEKKKSGFKCVVFGCNNSSRKDGTLIFHSFPKQGQSTVKIENKFGLFDNIDRHAAWVRVLRISVPILSHMRICCRHFSQDDYNLKGKIERCMYFLVVKFCDFFERNRMILLIC